MSEELSLVDVAMPPMYMQVIWVFNYAIDSLQQPLFEYLHHYCPTAFHHIIRDANRANCGQLVKSTTDIKNIFNYEEMIDKSITSFIQGCVQNIDIFSTSAAPSDTSPLFFMHQVILQDGTLLAVSIHHMLTDFHGLFELINRFSSRMRQPNYQVKEFVHNRSLLKPAIHVSYDHPEYVTIDSLYFPSESPAIKVLTKKCTKQELFRKFEITSNNVTFNDVLVAWVTQKFSEIRQIPLETTVNVVMTHNARTTWGVGADYFGNCSFGITMQFQMIDLKNCSIDELAKKVNNEKKASMALDYMQSGLAYMKASPVNVQLGYDPHCGTNLYFANLSRYPLYEVDFGQGTPKQIIFPQIVWDDGVIVILPTSTNQVELCIGCKEKDFDQLLDKFELSLH